MLINKIKRTSHLADFAIPKDNRVRLKESEKVNKFMDLARKLKNQWNMKVTVIPSGTGTLGIIAKNLEKRLRELELKERIEILQTTTLLRLAS